MGLPAHTRGSLSSRMSAIFQSRQLGQKLSAAGGLIHPLHHLGGGRLADSSRAACACPSCASQPGAGRGSGGRPPGRNNRAFSAAAAYVISSRTSYRRLTSFSFSPRRADAPCAQDLVEAAHGNAGLCAGDGRPGGHSPVRTGLSRPRPPGSSRPVRPPDGRGRWRSEAKNQNSCPWIGIYRCSFLSARDGGVIVELSRGARCP